MKRISFVLFAILLVATLASCKKTTVCEHEYATAFDAFCNKCGETRDIDAFDFTEADDDDNTCSICGGTDDGDCTTPVLCNKCSTVLIEAKSHDFSGTWKNDTEGHWRVCTNEKCKVTDTKESHISQARSIAPTAENCAVCEHTFSADKNDAAPLSMP